MPVSPKITPIIPNPISPLMEKRNLVVHVDIFNPRQKLTVCWLKQDVNPKHLEQLLSYMYRGEINVLQNDLGPLIETARGLQIKVGEIYLFYI